MNSLYPDEAVADHERVGAAPYAISRGLRSPYEERILVFDLHGGEREYRVRKLGSKA